MAGGHRIRGSQNVTFTDATSTLAATGPVLYFAKVAGVTVAGQQEALVSGRFTLFINFTGAIHAEVQ